jgi:ribosome maturation factor RimP
VRATLRDGVQLTGRVGESDESGVTLDVSGTPRRLEFDAITKALVQIEFNRKDG